MLAESGAVEPKHTGPFKLYAADKEGIMLHDVLFAPFFAGAAGPGQIWHWDVYVAANNLWWQFGRFREAVKGLDPAGEAFEPLTAKHPRLRVYVLKGRRTVLAWCRDTENTLESELKNGVKPEVLQGVEVNLGAELAGKRVSGARVYSPWPNDWREATVRRGWVHAPALTRSVVVRVELRR